VTTTAAAPSFSVEAFPGRDRALLVEGRAQAREPLDAGVGARPLVLRHHDRVLLPLRHGDGNDLGVELAGLHRGAGAPVALDGEGVLLLAGDVELPRDELAGVAHVVVVVDVPETVEDHPVEQLSVPEPLPGARLGQVVGRVGHRLHAAGHDDLGVAGPDGLRRERDRLEAGPADLVHRHRGNRHAEAGPDRGLAGRILPAGGLEDLAHQNLVHGLRIHAGAGDRVLDRDGAQVGGLEAGEGALETGDGSAATGDDDGFSHDTDLSGQGDR
jgi:hypothetical protein